MGKREGGGRGGRKKKINHPWRWRERIGVGKPGSGSASPSLGSAATNKSTLGRRNPFPKSLSKTFDKSRELVVRGFLPCDDSSPKAVFREIVRFQALGSMFSAFHMMWHDNKSRCSAPGGNTTPERRRSHPIFLSSPPFLTPISRS